MARQIIRRNCNSLLKSVKQAPGLPTQILAVISKKFTFAIGLTDESYRSMAATTYLVDSFVFRPNQQPPLPKPVLTLEAPPHHTAQETHSAYHYRKQSCWYCGMQLVSPRLFYRPIYIKLWPSVLCKKLSRICKKLYALNLQAPSEASPPGAAQDEHELLDLHAASVVNTSACHVCSYYSGLFAYSYNYTLAMHIS